MATIASLGVSLTARIGDFEKGFKKARKIANSFASDIGSHIKTVAGYGSAIVGVAGGAAAYLVKQQLEAVDSTSKLSRTLGIGTEAFVGYQDVMALAGVESDDFKKAVVKMNSAIIDAAGGAQGARQDLRRFGVTAGQLAKLSTDKRIQLIADGYTKIGDAATRSSALTGVFGKGGIALGAAFEQGSKGIRDAQQAAKDAGRTFTDVQGIAVENANDAMTRFGLTIDGVARNLAITLAPYIEVVSNRLSEFARQGNSSGEIVVNALGQIFMAAAKLADAFSLAQSAWNAFATGVQITGAFVAKSLSVIWSIMKNGIVNTSMLLTAGALTGPLDAIASDLYDAATKSGEAMKSAWESFTEGAYSKKAERFFEKLKADATATSQAVTKMTDKKPAPGSALSTKFQFAQQVDLKRVVVGGPANAKENNTTFAQGQTMIDRLNIIARNTGGGRTLIQ